MGFGELLDAPPREALDLGTSLLPTVGDEALPELQATERSPKKYCLLHDFLRERFLQRFRYEAPDLAVK